MVIYKMGSSGKEIEKIQQYLFDHKYYKDIIKIGVNPVDGQFGINMHLAVEAWQAASFDQQNNPLIADGEIGPISYQSMFGKQIEEQPKTEITELSALAVIYAQKEVGIKEQPSGSNWGSKVSEYLKVAGYNDPEPWCAAFVYYCFNKAALHLEIKNPLPKTGYCPDLYKGINYHLSSNDIPQCGDVFFVPGTNRLVHTGIVTSYKDGFVGTIEGNTNSGGGREGEGVYSRQRKAKTLVFAREV